MSHYLDILNLNSGIIETVPSLEGVMRIHAGRADIAEDNTATRTEYAELVNMLIINGNPLMNVVNDEFYRLFRERV